MVGSTCACLYYVMFLQDDTKNYKELMLAKKVAKKTKKRQRKLTKSLQALKVIEVTCNYTIYITVLQKHKKKSKAPISNFSALYLLNDPQSFVEKLYKQLEHSNERFEVRLMMMDLISKLMGIHQLFLFNFYPFLQRYLQPHQKDVTKILLYFAQSCHNLVPPEVRI